MYAQTCYTVISYLLLVMVIVYLDSENNGVPRSVGSSDDVCNMHGRFQQSKSSVLCTLVLSQVPPRSLQGQTAWQQGTVSAVQRGIHHSAEWPRELEG